MIESIDAAMTAFDVVKTLVLAASPARVWRAVTDPKELVQWFPDEKADVTVEPDEEGAWVWEGHGAYAVKFEVVDAPVRLVWSWSRDPDEAFGDGPVTRVEFLLEPNEDGGTTLHLRESGFRREEDRRANDGGWDKELGELVEYLTANPQRRERRGDILRPAIDIPAPGGSMSTRSFRSTAAVTLLGLTAASLLTACGTDAAGEPGSQEDTSLRQIEIPVGDMTFDAWTAGPSDGDLVMLLHGFPQTGYSYRHQLETLGAAGYLAVAPDQRGYSPRARPEGVDAYVMGNLIQDLVGMVAALGRQQFHVVGHDWGGAVAWVASTSIPDRIKTVTVLSTPHTSAFGRDLADPDSEQSQRSSYFQVFAAEGAENRFLENDGEFFRGLFQGAGIEEEAIAAYWDVLGTPAAMRAALNWYSAMTAANASASPLAASSAPARTAAPTLYIWGADDGAFSPSTSRATEEFVDGPYEGHELEGHGHWIPEQGAEFVSERLLEHIRTHG